MFHYKDFKTSQYNNIYRLHRTDSISSGSWRSDQNRSIKSISIIHVDWPISKPSVVPSKPIAGHVYLLSIILILMLGLREFN